VFRVGKSIGISVDALRFSHHISICLVNGDVPFFPFLTLIMKEGGLGFDIWILTTPVDSNVQMSILTPQVPPKA
jgi:hypothetical protein